ncbi:hypothetical protein LX97_02982 [Nonlabens dokdonensis]|uniref:Uncharacterized protein n=2 Tax=Nonlabens dokdonensis TaxID=328515 RepID=L7WD94_NONDD|nr:hypothetical protein [Nonlabens dokdonensis]AGC78222.1 hypothetical protein DDD_3095 [Nonlabens dokdonensis DSW-6]PZX37887.1 hypothetical protein LX97_02982 [Nonlabens dokdonensis]
MKVTFTTKEQSNLLQEEEFLKLSGGERLMRFISISTSMINMPQARPFQPNPDNFILEKKKK